MYILAHGQQKSVRKLCRTRLGTFPLLQSFPVTVNLLNYMGLLQCKHARKRTVHPTVVLLF